MKFIVVLATILAVALAVPADTYDSKYDNFNAEEVAGNIRLLKSYGNCFLGKGPCTAEGTDFKKVIPEAIRTKCGKCTPKQRELVRVVVKGFQSKLPEVWDELVKKEDPKGEFTQAFREFINSSD